jgi:hypothetical protein
LWFLFAQAPCRMWDSSTLQGLHRQRTTVSSLQPVSPPIAVLNDLRLSLWIPAGSHETEPVEVAARRTLLLPVARLARVSPSPAHGPPTGWAFILSNKCQYPPVLRRHLFRRHHLCLQRRLAAECWMPLLGFPKIAPPSYAAEESTPAPTLLPSLRDEQNHCSSLFRLHGFPPP